MRQGMPTDFAVAYLVKITPSFMKPEVPLPCLQQPVSEPYFGPDESSSHRHTQLI
jgi:hypothetical protein